MANIINPYRFGSGGSGGSGGGSGGGSDYVTISTSATINEDSYDSNYKYIEFDSTTTSAFEVTDAGSSSGSNSIEVYVIGGGGAGTDPSGSYPPSSVGASGGGGAGGYIRHTTFTNASSLLGTYDVTVGAGGTTSGGTSNTAGADSQVVKQGERSISFDGSSHLVTGNNSDFTFGTGDFTVEFWVNPSQVADQWKAIIADDHYAATNYGWIIYQSYDDLKIYRSGATNILTKTDCFDTGKWMHIAWVRSSGTSTLYVNGVAEDTYSDSTNYNGDKIYIGQRANGNYDYEGSIYGVRVVNGSAVYTAAFNPSMEKLTAITNTKLLINPTTSQSTWTDSSASGHTLTGSGWSDFSSSLDSSTPLMRAFGGGAATSYGGSYSGGKLKGGSGGGGSYSVITGPAGFNGQGNKGGDRGSNYQTGGGGGADSAGYSGTGGSSTTSYGGDGGDALEVSWMYDEGLGYDGDGKFAGGGGGGGLYGGGSGGGGGAGEGGDNSSTYASDGEANSGGGGGGDRMWDDGGAGGSGKVIVRWENPDQ